MLADPRVLPRLDDRHPLDPDALEQPVKEVDEMVGVAHVQQLIAVDAFPSL